MLVPSLIVIWSPYAYSERRQRGCARETDVTRELRDGVRLQGGTRSRL